MDFLISQISGDKHKKNEEMYDTWHFISNDMSVGHVSYSQATGGEGHGYLTAGSELFLALTSAQVNCCGW